MNGDVLVKATVWVLSLVLALVFISLGVGKLAGFDAQVSRYQSWGMSAWDISALGALEFAGGVGLLIPRVALVGALLLSLEMAVLAMVHFSFEEPQFVTRALVLMFMLLGISYLRVTRMTLNGQN
ncbi:DoxX family protein [Emcibacter sp.]|uniref:DoxX family protein n=1 Tax=Emcibacter sp. TaxID=1979954 RepID=UPI003A8F3BFE